MNQNDFDKEFSEIQMALKAGNSSYYFKNNNDIWENIGELPLDKSLKRLAELYLVFSETQKGAIYTYCGNQNVVLENLWVFIRRVGSLIHSKDDVKWLEIALASALIDGGRADYRDLIVSLVVVRFIAERCDIDFKSVIDFFIQSASEEMKGILKNVRDHSERDLHYTVQNHAPPEWVAESVKVYGVFDMQAEVKAMREQDKKQRQVASSQPQKNKSFLKTFGDLFKRK